MLLFGDQAVYLSHLPMFAPPHNFQVILEVTLDEAGREAIASARDQEREDYHTFVPEPFPITELDPGQGSPRASIEGAIHRGHFERGGPLLAEDVVATVREVVHFRELAPEAERDTERDLTYLCFGRPGSLYLAHEVSAQPDFDQVLRAHLIPGTGSDQAGRPLPDDVAAMASTELSRSSSETEATPRPAGWRPTRSWTASPRRSRPVASKASLPRWRPGPSCTLRAEI